MYIYIYVSITDTSALKLCLMYHQFRISFVCSNNICFHVVLDMLIFTHTAIGELRTQIIILVFSEQINLHHKRYKLYSQQPVNQKKQKNVRYTQFRYKPEFMNCQPQNTFSPMNSVKDL